MFQGKEDMRSLIRLFKQRGIVKYPKYSTLKDGQIRESLELVDFGKLIR